MLCLCDFSTLNDEDLVLYFSLILALRLRYIDGRRRRHIKVEQKQKHVLFSTRVQYSKFLSC